jgi:Mo-dependent nitrogenase C-terminus
MKMTVLPLLRNKVDLLQPIRQWMEALAIPNPRVARVLCTLIPAQCPFARDIKFGGHTFLHIPPLCKLNPLFEQFVSLRFRALSYLADECGEDITSYVI